MPKKIKTVFRSYQGRHFFSRWLRKIFERSHVQQILGLSLMMVVFSLSVLSPQALAFVETIQINSLATQEEMPVETTTEVTFRYPLTSFDISQGFSWRHWGLDLTAPEGTPIYPVAKGKVMEVGQSAWGYGNYLLIDHQNGQRSLYAHLSKQESKIGDLVDKETTIGLVGHTGWATGNHLHLEIYENGLPLNPSEVLPEK